jgi:hypothetical protein
MEKSGQLHASAALPPEKDPLLPIGWEAVWAPEPVWTGGGGKEKNSQPLPGLEPPIIQPIVHRYTTEVSRFLSAG